MTVPPAALDHAAIAARIPHRDPMCLLHSLLDWSADDIRCAIVNHADLAHPLRSAGGLLAPCAIEYAAQAMALHAALCAGDDAAPVPGFLASARAVRLHAARLDDAPGPLQVLAVRQAAARDQALYRFELRDASGRLLVDGRAAVVLNTPLRVGAR